MREARDPPSPEGAPHAPALKLQAWGSAEGPLPASVREMAPAADTVTRTFLVRADVGATALRLGQTASVLIDAPSVAGVIKLPLPAVFEQGGVARVWLVNRQTMQVQARPVQIAGAEGNLVLVGAGLAAGETVVTAGVHVLTEGQKVRWYAEPGAISPVGPALGGPPRPASPATPTASLPAPAVASR